MLSFSRLIATAVTAASLAFPVARSARVAHPTLPRLANRTAPTMQAFSRRPNTGRKLTNEQGLVVGTVASISGTVLTLTGPNNTTYTIDASQAKVMGGMMTGPGLSLANVQVGDKLMVMGTINGTSVVAKTLADRSFEGRNIFSGSVTAVNGSLLTISSRSKTGTTTYMLDVSSATISKGAMKNQTMIQPSEIMVGDHLSAVGSLSGSTVRATSVSDMGNFKKMGKGMFHGHRGDRHLTLKVQN